MSVTLLNEAVRHVIFTERDTCKRWDSVRMSLVKRLEISEEQADEILVFIEASHVDQRLRKACDEWACDLDPTWHTTWHIESVHCARSAAFEARKRAIELLTHHCQYTELQANSILRFLTAGAQGSLFQTDARNLARTLGLDWQSLVVAAVGGCIDAVAAKAVGHIFSELLEDKGISDEEFAARAGTDVESVQNMKSGTLDLTLQDSFNSAEALGMTWPELIACFDGVRPVRK